MIKQCLVIFFLSAKVFLYESYLIKLPNNQYIKTDGLTSCQICHFQATPTVGNSGRNNFGRDFALNGRCWNVSLALLDSDGDGYDNATELRCNSYECKSYTVECGTNYFKATNPGDGSVYPTTSTEHSQITYIAQEYIKPSPNPFNPTTKIYFHLAGSNGMVSLQIINSRGVVVRNISTHFNGEGYAYWNGRDDNNKPLSAGIYTVTARAHTKRISTKLILNR